MTKNFWVRVRTSDGPRTVHVNRRHCRGRWTKKDQNALEAIVEAVSRYCVCGHASGSHARCVGDCGAAAKKGPVRVTGRCRCKRFKARAAEEGTT